MNALRAAWFAACCIVGAAMLVQLPATPGNQGLVFVVTWAMLTPLMRVPEGAQKWKHLARGLVGGMAVWVLSALKDGTLAREPRPLMALFSVGVVVFAAAAWFTQSRRDGI
jgi:hypothetical protein